MNRKPRVARYARVSGRGLAVIDAGRDPAIHEGMVVLVMLGTAAKLAVVVGLTYRTRTWWMPGAAAIGGGAAALCLPFPRVVGVSAIGLGAVALVVARSLHVPSRR